MPRSCSLLRQDIRQYLIDNYDNTDTILDVGPGEGTYYNLLSDYFTNMDAVEVWPAYIDTYSLKTKYNNVYNKNILDFEFDYYDIIIMGDILEHITPDRAIELVERLVKKCKQLVIAVPFNMEQGPRDGIWSEKHEQPDLSYEIMKERYPALKLLYSAPGMRWNGDYCIYIKK